MNFEQEIIKKLQQKNWRLVDPVLDHEAWQTFVQSVKFCVDRSKSGDMEKLPYCVTVAYSPILYEAANCTTDKNRRELAFTELFEWIYPRLMAHHHVPTEDAKELAQEVLITVFETLGKVDRPQGFFPYVSRIMLFKTYEYRRRQGRREELFPSGSWDEDDGYLERVADETIFFDTIELQEAELILMDKIENCMPVRAKRQKAILKALVFGGLTYHEIASDWGKTPSTLYTLWHNARKNFLEHCRKLLNDILQRHKIVLSTESE